MLHRGLWYSSTEKPLQPTNQVGKYTQIVLLDPQLKLEERKSIKHCLTLDLLPLCVIFYFIYG
ncbi:hypothetical protein RchiOBHm_Chr6g0304191 [Rosa chinensis]|uniref:Uncharacterized protein n=1 Tax=Rosa chinensis TaxID=74649 RepID=A0A2P6PZK2_ROSCH|nr:hypothetical protein RchiOBHm_Chr6g0304191 [Rosa chinensis]